MEPLSQNDPVQPSASQVAMPPPIDPVPPLPPSQKPFFKRVKVMVPVLIAAIIILVSAALYVVFAVLKPGTKSNISENPTQVTNTPRFWVGCSDVRNVIDDGGKLYAACLGGVIVVDKITGEVTDQIGEPDGLSNRTATSMVKKGDILYIGTQDGMTIFNLKSRQAQKISVKEGLPSGSNIQVEEDGQNVWIGTFDGVGLYNTATGKLTAFTSQLDSQATEREIPNIFVTTKYVYFLENSNAYSSGAVIRYEKSSGTFKTYKPDSFGVTGQYAYVNFTSIGSFGNKVFVSDGSNIYEINEETDTGWKKIDSPNAFIKNDLSANYSSVWLLRNTDTKGILLNSDSKIYRYIPDTDSTEIVYDFSKVNSGIIHSSEGRVVWFIVNNEPKVWVGALDLDANTITKYSLKDRPKDFGRTSALIDDELLIDGNLGIYKYSLTQNKFILLTNLTEGLGGDLGQYTFQPISGTKTAFVLHQTGGQGCGKPGVVLYNYLDGTITNVDFPANLISEISQPVEGGTAYQCLSLSWMDQTKGQLGIWYNTGESVKYLAYDVNLESWSTPAQVPDGVERFDQTNGVVCNNVYSFTSNGNKFSDPGCFGTAQSGNLSWEIVKGVVYETDSQTKVKRALDPPVEAAYYTPFETVSPAVFTNLIFVNGKLWIGSNRGLSSYNPKDGTFKLYGSAQGLLSKEVTGFLVGSHIWVVTNWGGLSEINE